MDDETKRIVEFHYQTIEGVPLPTPASKAVPEWMKRMPAHVPEEKAAREDLGTVKRCMPFLDAMTCGYVIPLAADVNFHLVSPGSLTCESSAQFIVGGQEPLQVAGTPLEGRLVVKFMNTWVVKTPPGYSTLFLPVLNQFTVPFQILAGLVETDTYYRQVHFPAICNMTPGQRCSLAKGTPIAQAIPIKRESWEGRHQVWERERVDQIAHENDVDSHFYGKKYWTRKEYR